MGETTVDRRRLTRANALVLGLLALFAPLFVRTKNDRIVVYNPLHAQQDAGALPQDELAALAKAASWLMPAGNAKAGAKIADAIRKDPSSFAVFARFHTDEERREALARVPYGKLIAKAADKNAVDSLLIASVVEVESTFRPEAGSHKGAVGLMQLLPKTAGLSRQRLQNPAENLEAGSAYLAQLIDRFDGDLGLALAAYNAGPTNVRRYNGVPPFPETQAYVEKVLTKYVSYHQQLWASSGAAQLVASL
jgi:soluble lytic murein transglycosylase-like protein